MLYAAVYQIVSLKNEPFSCSFLPHTLTPSLKKKNTFHPNPQPSQETQRLIADPVPGISATPYTDNLRYFGVAIEGPAETSYANGVFQVREKQMGCFLCKNITLQDFKYK